MQLQNRKIMILVFLFFVSCKETNGDNNSESHMDTLVYIQVDANDVLEFEGFYFENDTTFFKTISYNNGIIDNIIYNIGKNEIIGQSFYEDGTLKSLIKYKNGVIVKPSYFFDKKNSNSLNDTLDKIE